MPTLKEKIEKDFREALKKKEEAVVSTLKLLKVAIFNKELDKRYRISKEKKKPLKEIEKEISLNDEEVQEVIISEIKKRKESILEFSKHAKGTKEQEEKIKKAIEKEKFELEVLQRYLPPPISREEIEILAVSTIKKLGAKGLKDMGRVMKDLIGKLKGRVDGSLVSEIVRNLLLKNEKSNFSN